MTTIVESPQDLQVIVETNNAALPHVNRLDVSSLSSIVDEAFYFKQAQVDGTIAGFLLALRAGATYQSLNYRWFSERYSEFVYVDRIVVEPGFQGCGIGSQLYADLEQCSHIVAPVITCEVNLLPPNPNSLKFHQNRGFHEVGRQTTEGGQKMVCLMRKSLSNG